MGYSPNSAASALSNFKQDSQTKSIHSSIAWLNAWRLPANLRKFCEFDAYWTGLEESVRPSGYRLEEFIIDESVSLQRLAKILHVRNIQGIVIPPQQDFVADDWAAFPWNDFSVVRIGRSMTAVSSHLVGPDHATNTILAFHEIQQRGYQRIGFIGINQTTHMGTGGLLQVNAQVPAARRVTPLLCEKPLGADDHQLIASWLLHEKPDAILCDQIMVPVLLAKLGVRVPEDVALAAMGISEGSAGAGIDQNGLEIGEAAGAVLLALIRANDRGIPLVPKETLLSGKWVDGPSMPICKNSPAD